MVVERDSAESGEDARVTSPTYFLHLSDDFLSDENLNPI